MWDFILVVIVATVAWPIITGRATNPTEELAWTLAGLALLVWVSLPFVLFWVLLHLFLGGC